MPPGHVPIYFCVSLRMRIDRIIITVFIGFILIVFTIVLTIQWKVEYTELNLSNGKMRMVTKIITMEDMIEDIESNLEWVGEVSRGRNGEQWVQVSNRDYRLIRGARYKRMVGLVYMDAFTMAKVMSIKIGSSLPDSVAMIQDASFEQIWGIRQSLRTSYDDSLK